MALRWRQSGVEAEVGGLAARPSVLLTDYLPAASSVGTQPPDGARIAQLADLPRHRPGREARDSGQVGMRAHRFGSQSSDYPRLLASCRRIIARMLADIIATIIAKWL